MIDTTMDIDLIKDQLRKLSLAELATEMRSLREGLDEIKKEKALREKLFDFIRLSLMPELLDDEGVSTATIKGVGRISVQSDIYFTIPAEKREEAYDWLRANGHGDLIKETVNAGSGKAFAKECIREGIELPDSIFKVTPFSRAQLTIIK